MFEPEKSLRSLIIENLPEDGISISALSRLLNKKGVKMHRLELSGYLKALSDMNVLKERDIKPSKVFSVSQSKSKGIYQQLGEAVSQEEDDEDKRANLALFTLNKLFKRAIFEKELRMCGLTGIPSSKSATDKERSQAASVVMKAGLKISANDNALFSTASLNQAYHRVLVSMLIEMTNLKHLVAETQQKTLEEE